MELKVITQVSPDPPKPSCCAQAPEWTCGAVRTPVGEVFRVSTDWSRADYLGQARCRISGLRMKYRVEPGLYAVGEPDGKSDVIVSANYKLSFDILRRELKGMNTWILVLDTGGINVWCAAGKSTFGTAELVKRIRDTQLEKIVSHRKVVLPQLGAPGIQAHIVKKLSGFRVYFGPVYAGDIRRYLEAGYKATKEMRTVRFSMLDRLVLTPMEIIPAFKKFPLYVIGVLLVFGLQPQGILFKEAWTGGAPFLFVGVVSVLAGAFATPVLLPFVPFRSFAIKGLITGVLAAYFSLNAISVDNVFLIGFSYLFFPAVTSYIALQFTGSTPFTGMSGVKKEVKVAVPLYFITLAAALVLLTLYKVKDWGWV